MNPGPPVRDPRLPVDLNRLAEELHQAFVSTRIAVPLAARVVHLKLGWELFDDPLAPGKLMVVRWFDAAAAEGGRMAGKLSAALRAGESGGVLLDCTNPFHGVNLRPPYHRQGLVGGLMRDAIFPHLPRPYGVLAPVGPGTAAGVALEFWRSYMAQRRGPDWLDSPEGRQWWTTLPQNQTLDWEAAGGYPAVFALLRAVGLDQRLQDPARLLATSLDPVLESPGLILDPFGGNPA